MHNIMVIACGTLVRQIRNKVLYVLIAMVACFVAIGTFYRVLSLGAEARLMRNMGLAGVNMIGMVVAVFIGANEVGKELREGTVDELLAKPLGRDEFLMGKFVGTYLVAIFNMGLMAACFAAIMYHFQGTLGFDLFRSLVMNIFEVGIIIGVAIFFTTFLPETVSAIFTFLVFVLGHGVHMLPVIIERSEDIALTVIGNLAYYIIPNLHHFNLRRAVGHEMEIPASYMAMALLYGICYSVLILSLAILVFRRKEL